MFFKGLIIDLDNTIYNYKECNDKSFNHIFKFISNRYNISVDDIWKCYQKVNAQVKNMLNNTASSHNRFIYIKQIFEFFCLGYSDIECVHDMFWNTFYENMTINEGVIELLTFLRKIGIKACILTDFLTQYQITKINTLKLFGLIDHIVTSEEIGIEKPSKNMYYKALDKLKLNPTQVIMIGDDYEKDINGSRDMGIYPFWFSDNIGLNIGPTETVFNKFTDLYYLFSTFEDELIFFEHLSKMYGERFDLVQAGGGNISFKYKNLMAIKASGYSLSQVDVKTGYSIIDNEKYKDDIKQDYFVITTIKPSIETPLHSFLSKYTVHLHPIQINNILVRHDCKLVLQKLFPDSLILDYCTPGEKLYNELKMKYSDQKIIFLLNHGVIYTSDSREEITQLIGNSLDICEQYIGKDFSAYKNVNIISDLMNRVTTEKYVTIHCQDKIIDKYFKNKADFNSTTFPDKVVYCGISWYDSDLDINALITYIKEYGIPKIFLFENNIYITSTSLYKCYDIEKVLKASLMINDTKTINICLENKEVNFLINWDREKYRQQVSI